MGVTDGTARAAAALAREALRPALAVERRVRTTAEDAALATLDAVLGSALAAGAVDRVVRSPLVERAATGLLQGPLVDAIAAALIRDAVIERLSTEMVRAGVPERVAASLVDEGVVERVLDSQRAEVLVGVVADSPGMERMVGRVLDSRLLEGGMARLLASEELWVMVEEIAQSPAVSDAIAHQGLSFADEMAGEVRTRSRRIDDRLARLARRALGRPDVIEPDGAAPA